MILPSPRSPIGRRVSELRAACDLDRAAHSAGVEFNQHDVVVVVGAVGGERADQPLDRGATASVSAADFDWLL
jgi:hypothetical protein